MAAMTPASSRAEEENRIIYSGSFILDAALQKTPGNPQGKCRGFDVAGFVGRGSRPISRGQSNVKAISVHDLGPCGREGFEEQRFTVSLAEYFCLSPQDRI